MKDSEKHECAVIPGTEILKSSEGLWELRVYSIKDVKDPAYRPLPETILPTEDWRDLGFWDISQFRNSLVIRYCPYCGEKLLGNEGFYKDWEKNINK